MTKKGNLFTELAIGVELYDLHCLGASLVDSSKQHCTLVGVKLFKNAKEMNFMVL